MSIDEIRHRRLREIRGALVGEAKGTINAAPLMAYFSAPHHGSSEAPYHIDLAPGTHIILEGYPEQSVVNADPRGRRLVEDAVFVFDSNAVNRTNLPRYFSATNTSDHNTPSDSTPASPDVTLLFFFFMSKAKRDSFLGDLEERHGLVLKSKGRRAATRWLWREVIHSCVSLALDALKRLSALEKLIERYRRIGS